MLIGTGERPRRLTASGGREHASVRTGGPSQRSSRMPRRNEADMGVASGRKDRTEHETSSVSVETLDESTSLELTADPSGKIAVAPVCSYPSGKPSALKGARSVWNGGKAVKPYLSLEKEIDRIDRMHKIQHRDTSEFRSLLSHSSRPSCSSCQKCFP